MAKKGMLSGKGVSLDDLSKDQVIEQPEPEVQPEVETKPETAPQKETPPAPVAEAPPVETPPVVTPPEPTPEPPKVDDPASIQTSGENLEFLKLLNTKFNLSFESEDQVKAAIEKPTMESELQALQTQHTDLQSKFDLLTEQLDPKTLFSSDEAMKLEIWKKQNPDKDASIAQTLFSTDDLSSVSDLQMVKIGRKFSNPKLPGTEKDLEDAIAEEFGVEQETPFEEWPKTAQIRLASAAGEYRDRFKTMKGEVKIPERVDLEALRTERQQATEQATAKRTEAWNEYSAKAAGNLSSLKVPIGEPKEGEEPQFFTWDLGKAPVDKVGEMAKGYIAMGIENTEETQGLFDRAVRNVLIEENLSRMFEAYGKDILARQEEQHLEETHNPAPLTDSQRTAEGTEDGKKKEQTAFAVAGSGSALFNNPLFKITE